MDGLNSIGRRLVIREFTVVRNASDLLAKAFGQIAADSMPSIYEEGELQPCFCASEELQLSEGCS